VSLASTGPLLVDHARHRATGSDARCARLPVGQAVRSGRTEGRRWCLLASTGASLSWSAVPVAAASQVWRNGHLCARWARSPVGQAVHPPGREEWRRRCLLRALVLPSLGRLGEAQLDRQWRLLVQRLLLLTCGEVVACVRGARGCRWGKRCAHEERSVGAGVSCEHLYLTLVVGCARHSAACSGDS
jgi:hypothetical protein